MTPDFDEIVETFDFLEDWEDRYRYIIELGKSYQSLEPRLRTDAIKVEGCASQVWMLPRIVDGKFGFDGASDAIIVEGLIAVLAALYNGKSLSEAKEIDALQQFQVLGLDQHLSSQRSNGLRAMIQRVGHFLEAQ